MHAQNLRASEPPDLFHMKTKNPLLSLIFHVHVIGKKLFLNALMFQLTIYHIGFKVYGMWGLRWIGTTVWNGKLWLFSCNLFWPPVLWWTPGFWQSGTPNNFRLNSIPDSGKLLQLFNDVNCSVVSLTLFWWHFSCHIIMCLNELAMSRVSVICLTRAVFAQHISCCCYCPWPNDHWWPPSGPCTAV